MSEEHIALVTRLFGDFTEARLALVLDGAGKEIERRVLMPGEPKPAAPDGGKVRWCRSGSSTARLRLPHDHR